MGIYKDMEARRAYLKKYNEANKERIRAWHAAYYLAKREKKLAHGRAWREANPERARAYVDAWHADPANKARRKVYSLAYVTRRNAEKLLRPPNWLTADDHWMMDEAYDLAARRERITGGKWHVDHVIPLFGRKVSGLHVPTNLQVIPAIGNIRKGNRVTEGNFYGCVQ